MAIGKLRDSVLVGGSKNLSEYKKLEEHAHLRFTYTKLPRAVQQCQMFHINVTCSCLFSVFQKSEKLCVNQDPILLFVMKAIASRIAKQTRRKH